MLRWTQKRNQHISASQIVVDDQKPPSKREKMSTTASQDMSNKFASIRSNKSSMTTRFKSLVSSVQEELQCVICLEEYQTPRLLKCGHSFCTSCLVSFAPMNQQIKCPTCRFVTKLSSSSARPIEELPINYAIKSILDIVNSSTEKRIMFCTTHLHEEVKFFCTVCDEMLCSECMVNSMDKIHQGHRIVTLKQASVMMFEELAAKTNKTSQVLDDTNVGVKIIGTQIEDLEKTHQGLLKAIDDEFEDLSRKLNERRDKLYKELEEKKVIRLKELEGNMAQWLEFKTCLETSIRKSDQLFANKLDNIPYPTTKEIYRLWKEGPTVRDELDELLVRNKLGAVVVDINSDKLKDRFLQCSFSQQEKTLLDQSIDLYGHVSIEDEPQISMQVFVKGVDGKTEICNITQAEHFVEDLMKKVSIQTKIPIDLLRLYHQGKLLLPSDENSTKKQTMKACGIAHESVVHLGLGLNTKLSEVDLKMAQN